MKTCTFTAIAISKTITTKYTVDICAVHPSQCLLHSEKMAYSFEALGIDVGALVNEYFAFPLLWYKKGTLPEYSAIVCGLLTNEDLSFELLRQKYFAIIKD